MTAILGVSAFYHDSAAALIVDGEIVAAAQEERFSRKKHDADFPRQAVAWCLSEAGIGEDRIDYIAYYEKPFVKFDRLLETYLAFAPRGFRSFSRAIPLWLKQRLHMRKLIHEAVPGSNAPLLFLDHHESHAASAFFPSPFDRAAILTLDGVGEWSTASMGTGDGHTIKLSHHLRFPHSLGMLYSAFTYYCGFKVNSGEYKLMGLAPFGQPVYRDVILKHLIDVKADGSFWLDMDYFNYCQGLTMTSRRFHALFGGEPRQPEAPILQRHMDLAASVQSVTEDVMLKMAEALHRTTGMNNLVLAGGVALNCVANARILAEGPYRDLWIQPAAGDAGGALGSALFVWHQVLQNPRTPARRDSQRGSLLGPRISNDEAESVLKERGAPFRRFPDEAELLDFVARELMQGRIVGWFQDRMEFGPRALGARSILADPRAPGMQAKLNIKIKFRETFRPFAPAVLEEKVSEWFRFDRDRDSPYMLVVAPVADHHRAAITAEEADVLRNDPDLRKRVNIVRSDLPAVTHVDYTARLQTVDAARHGRFHRLLTRFFELTGCPILVNTSFNVRGEPIVRTAEDAYRCFLATDMDVVVIENLVVERRLLAVAPSSVEREKYVAQFEKD